MIDGGAGRHILLPRESERGHLDSEQSAGVARLVRVSHLSPSLASDIRWSLRLEPRPPALYHPPSCPSEHLVSHSVRLITYL